MLQSNIFIDYTALKPRRDPIYGMYTLITARNNAKYSHLYFLVIWGHRRSLNVTKCQIFKNIIQGPNFLHVYSNLHYKLDRTCKFDPWGHYRSNGVTKSKKNSIQYIFVNLFPNHILVLSNTETIFCEYKIILMTSTQISSYSRVKFLRIHD